MLLEEIFGYIERITFQNPDNGFTVARLQEAKKAELTTIVGTLAGLQPGETVRLKGFWKHNPAHGMQFDVRECSRQYPADLVGIQKYLESGLIKGIGPAYAKRIVTCFGLKTLEVIDSSPDLLLDVPGLGEKRIGRIKECWLAQKAIRDVMLFLQQFDISPAFAHRIFKAWGSECLEKIRNDPYLMARDIYGIGFKTADTIALKMGLPHDAPKRIESGLEYLLHELSEEGHVCYPQAELVAHTQKTLDVLQPAIEEALERLVAEKRLVQENGCIWLKVLYLCESGIAREIARLGQARSALRAVDTQKAVAWVQEILRMQLAEQQELAVAQALASKLLIITGGPGTGKSTITKAILAITDKLTSKILLAAPTGRAAKRMSEITRRHAKTLHSLLEFDFTKGGFKRGKEYPLVCDLLIIDEASMIDTQLMYSVLKAVPNSSRVIFVGDIHQLPSVGPGNVLKDMIASTLVPVVTLTQIFRQAAGSKITVNAHAINDGIFPDIRGGAHSDFFFLEAEEAQSAAETIVDLVKNRLPKRYRLRPFSDIQVLSPMKKGVIGTHNLNLLLQQALNPKEEGLFRNGQRYLIGDKVMQIRNNYDKEVYNGDIGLITEIDVQEQQLVVDIDGRPVTYDFSELDELTLAYAVSIHKYQGSECPCVVIPVHTSHFMMLHRNLLYTGVTRGKRLVVLVGTKKALAIAVKNNQVIKRHTGLKDSLAKIANPTCV